MSHLLGNVFFLRGGLLVDPSQRERERVMVVDYCWPSMETGMETGPQGSMPGAGRRGYPQHTLTQSTHSNR